MNLSELTLKKFRTGLLNKKFSVVEVVQSFFAQIRKTDGEIAAYLNLMEESALVEARAIDASVSKGGSVGELAGAPLAIKDNILVEKTPATAASKILENYVACYDATVIKKLKSEKAIFLGKTNLDEFAMGSSTENSSFKLTRNPRDRKRVPGGSSGGSAAAVVGDMALAALGSDTGGSIRQPAAFCGVVGLRPTYGAVSRHGLIAMASSLDQIGPIAKTVEDAAILFKAIRGKDDFDSTSVDHEYDKDFLSPDLKKVKRLKIGIPKEYFSSGLEKEVSEAVDSVIKDLKSLKIEFKEINLPHTKYALSCYYIIVPAEISANLARFDGIRYARIKNQESGIRDLKDIYFSQRGIGFGEEVTRRILLGTFVLSAGYYDAYYTKAQKVRQLIKKDFDEAFREVNVLLTPTTPTRAFKIGEKIGDPLSMYASDIFVIPASLAGLPAISIPVKSPAASLPIGFQLIGKHFREADILGIGQYYEKT